MMPGFFYMETEQNLKKGRKNKEKKFTREFTAGNLHAAIYAIKVLNCILRTYKHVFEIV